jgi:hypothetical protein
MKVRDLQRQKFVYPAANQSSFEEKVAQQERGGCECCPVDHMDQVVYELIASNGALRRLQWPFPESHDAVTLT